MRRWLNKRQARRMAQRAVLRAARVAVSRSAYGTGDERRWDDDDLIDLALAVDHYERVHRGW